MKYIFKVLVNNKLKDNTIVVLLGYMGVGKTSIGEMLSQKLELPFFDLDDLLSKQENLSIDSIFKNKGEIYFRKREHEFLKNHLQLLPSCVLSLGGGTPCYANNHEFLKASNIISVYLQANVSTLVQRLKKEKQQRPLLATVEDLSSFVGQHLLERAFYYNKASLTVDTNNKTIEQIVQEISLHLT